jgi:hypothetical protein
VATAPRIAITERGEEIDQEDREIVQTVQRLEKEKNLNIAESAALLYVLQVYPQFWPQSPHTGWPADLINSTAAAERYGEAHNWFWTADQRKKIAEEKKDALLLQRADAIAWAQRFVLRHASKNLAEHMKDIGNGVYPTFMDSFHLNLKKIRSDFLRWHNAAPFEPPEEKSDEKGSGGTGFLIGAVLIVLLAVGILMYFLLR